MNIEIYLGPDLELDNSLIFFSAPPHDWYALRREAHSIILFYCLENDLSRVRLIPCLKLAI